MLASSLVILAAALNLASASPVQKIVGSITCTNNDTAPLIVGNLISLGPSGIPRKASFQGAEDGQSRLELSTSIDGTPSPDYPQFAFRYCDSRTMPSAVGAVGDSNEVIYYGQLSPNGHRQKCVAAETVGSSEPSPLISDACYTIDDSGLIQQWWSFTTSDVGEPQSGTLNFIGHTNSTEEGTIFYGFTNTYDAASDAHLVELVYSNQSQPNTGYTLSLQA
ncbi:hypothetical protein OC845_001987 [Tilletia horrida]|nr:hypothetical protein OC845_001987 [Tilletia horrida]